MVDADPRVWLPCQRLTQPLSREPTKGTRPNMDRTIFAQNQAIPAGAARPCAHRIGFAELGSAYGMSTVSGDWTVSKNTTRWLGKCLT